MSVNKVILLGRLGADPASREVNGHTVCNFNLATNEEWTDKNGTKQSKTEWHRIEVWGKMAGVCAQYLAKGREVFVEGKLSTRKSEEYGQMTNIKASNVRFIGGKNDTAPQVQQEMTADEIPF